MKKALKDQKISKQALEVLDNISVVGEHYQLVNEDPNAHAIFAKITPIKIKPQSLYGSAVPSETVNELVICKSKLGTNGDVIPNTKDIIVSCLIPERAMANLLFNQDGYTPSPVTFTKLANDNIEPYVNSISAKDDYMLLVNDIQQDIHIDAKAAEELISTFKNNPEKLKKEDIEAIREKISGITGHALCDMKYEMKDIACKMKTSAQHLNQEISATASGVLSGIAIERSLAKPLDISSSKDNPYLAWYSLNNKMRHEDFCVNVARSDKLTASVINELIERHAEHPRGNELAVSQSQGYLIMQKNYGYKNNLFGESSIATPFGLQESVFRFSVGFSKALKKKHTTDIEYSNDKEILRFCMSQCQLLGLLQSSLSNKWICATMTRHLNKGVDSTRLEKTYQDVREDNNAYKIEQTEADNVILSLRKELRELLSTGVRSKSGKQKFIEIAQAIIDAKDCMFSQKNEQIESKMFLFGSDLQNESIDLIKSIMENNPTVSNELKMMLLDRK
ncbi:hypothetical protein [Photobacterium kishitanii]|nr:hypothetical protein [Photobacterium kishitanii]